jgi:hypothetical protein
MIPPAMEILRSLRNPASKGRRQKAEGRRSCETS